MDFTVDIASGDAESALIYAPLHLAQKLFVPEAYEIISLAAYAKLLVATRDQKMPRLDANFVREGVIYSFADHAPRFVRCSPILAAAEQAARDHARGQEFHPDEEAMERAIVDSIAFPSSPIRIPANRLGQDELAVWAFGAGDVQRAEAFGEFLNSAGIKALPVCTLEENYEPTREPFVRQVWIGGHDGAFCLFPGRVADYDIPVRAIRRRLS